ncbi:calcium-binding protein, partial [Campylobacter ureolyticus]|uniref:calcium-binding protein n=1 Tax=Campylobacter ureolyticus TaxID=827 RepID=UPI0022CC01AC|nr:hypothetical protein [Campylobacter ureolyticus]
MNSLDRQIKAKVELDKAEKEAFEDVKNFENFFKFLQGATKGSELANNIYTLPYETDVKDLFQKYLKAKANSEVSNVDEFLNKKYSAKKWAERFGVAGGVLNAREELSKGNLARALIGAVADAGLLILPKIIKGSNLILIAIDVANIIDKATFDTGLFDISGMLKNFYDKKTGSRDGKKIEITDNGILQVTMPNGDVYARPLINSGKYSLFGDTKNDVLFGGNGNDMLIGHGGKDILIGGNGKDDYFVDNGDIIKDSDGNGRVFLENHQLTGGTQIEKGSKIYKGKDGVKYELKDNGDLLINDSITIENFSNDNLEIHLSEFDEINVSISDNQAVEKAGKMTFNIELSKEPELGQFVIVKVNDKTYKFVNFLETNYTFEDGVKLIHGSSATYEYTWSDDSLKEEDEKFEVSATATGSDGLKVSVIKNGNGLIKDDDQDNDPDPEREASPIVIDLGNDGINSHALNYTINFDLDNNGFKEATGWVSGDDALLAIDKNNNGIIDNGSELFGNKSISDSAFSYTNSSLNNGFETLKSYDTNNDGIIDSQDAEFDKLLLWQDKNGNAITDNGELIKLSDKVSSIDLNYTNTDINNNSNTIKQTSTATLNNGTKVKADDIWFKVNYKNTEEIIDESQIPFEIKALPNVTAFGNIHSLHYAMAKNETLATMVNLYLLMDSKTRKENINTLISEWAGVTNIDENAKRGYANARKVAVYELLTGKPFLQRGYNADPWQNASVMIEDYYNKFSNFVYATIELNTTYSYLNLDFDILKFDENLGKYSYDFNSLNSAIQSLYNDGNLDEISNLATIIRTVLTYKPYAYNLLKENYTLNFANEKELLSLLYGTHITGTANNDTLNGTNEADYLNGLGGNDTLNGGNGNDVYEFNGNFGNDTIYDTAGNDSIYLDINSDKISLKRELANLIIQTKDEAGELTGNKITIQNYFNINPELGNGVIENIKFADGTIWSINEILANAPLNATDGSEKFYLTDGSDEFNALDGDDTIYGGNGNDTINGDDGNDILYGDNGNDTLDGGAGNDNLQGGDGNDTLIGGIGNDSLQGGNGNDTYIYNLGDGADTITDYYGSNTIKFGEGISKEDLIIKKSSSNAIKICFKNNSTDSITLSNLNIENFEFANGDKLTFNDIKELPLYSSDENETIYGYNDKANIINALGGNDSVYGGNANDTLNGGDGNDTISAGNGNDTIKGGTGNDNLQGGNGDDIYVFNKGDGVDTIVDWHGNDTIKFNDFNQEDIELKRELTSLVITSKISDDKIVIQNFFDTNANTSNPIEKIIFKDSSEWNLNEILANATIKATDGNDKFYLTPNDDEFDALGGDDTIYAGNGNDNVNGNDGNDTLYADNGNDTLSGGTGNDKLYGGYGNDTYIYNLGDGDDTIEDVGGSETIKFGEGISKDDLIVQKVNNSSLKISFKNSSGSLMLNYAISNNNYAIENFEFANGDKLTFNDIKALSLIGSDENDTITGYNDMGGVIIGAKGNDSLNGGNKDEVYRYNLGDGDDTITERGGNNIIEFGEGISKSDISVVRHYNGLKIFINNENNQGSITITNDVSQAEVSLVPIGEIKFANGETLIFEEIRKLSLIGSDNNETIEGYWELDNIIDGKAGNDTIYGGNKNDTYIYNKGDGNDTISDTAGNDTIEFGEGISKDDIIISTLNNSGSLKISFKNDGGSITFSTAIENIKFANGETLNLEEIKTLSLIGKDSNDKIYGFANRDNEIQGNAGDDELNGNNANDTLIGGKGNDKLNGGNGNDTYIYNKGDGNDTISDTAGNDTIEFGEGISKDDIIISTLNNSGSLKISFKNDGGSITFSTAIENIKFANGETLNLEEIKTLSLIGKDSNDKIYGFANRDNEIQGNAGDDELNGNNANDTLIGGKGNDKLNGGNGDDTYIFNIGDGKDEIYEESGNDIIEFGDGISKDSLIIKRSEDNDLKIYIKDSPKIPSKDINLSEIKNVITIKNAFYYNLSNAENLIEIIKFQDGSTLNFNDIKKLSLINSSNSTETLRGYDDENNNIVGNDADETIYGGELDDTINAGAGNDTIYGLNSNDTIKGNDGDDTLYGEYGNDTLIGGTGNDTLQGGDGDDKYIFNLGDGKDEIYESSGNDTIEFGKGISKDSLIVIRDGENNLKIYVKDNPNIPNKDINLDEINDVITLKDVFSLDSSNSDQIIESVKFNDGSTMSFNELKKMSMLGLDNNQTNIKGYDDMENIIKASQKDTTIQGGDLKDTIYGGQNNDIINANDGNDTVYGNGGDDIIYGGSGDDILYGNEGNDTISDFEGNNKIFGGDGDDIITSIGTIYGDSGNDTIKTFTNNYNDDKVNTIYGGTGNDTLNGGVGSDIYMFNSNDGADIITDDGGDNTVKFTDINKDNITVKRGDNLNDLVIITDNNDSITIKNFYTRSSYKDENGSLLNAKNGNGIINKFIFADQTEFNYEEFHKLSYSGKDGDDLIYGLYSNDVINGGKGNDTIYARDGDDTLYGNDGDDILNGDLGNDTLIGGTGNDTLQGGDGDDKYIFNLGDGKDEIYESSGNDTIEFGKGISKDSLIVIRDGENNLKIYVKDNPNIPNKDINLDEINDVITLKDVFSLDSSNSDQIIESVKFNDGSTMSFNELKKMSMLGTKNNQAQIIGYDDMENLIKASNNDTVIQGGNLKDTIYGGNGNDVLNANAGDDTVYGGNGDDEIYGGDGDDTLYGNSGNDTVNGGLGNDIIYAGEGNDILNGDLGNDILVGGSGNDKLQGGDGDDKYIFNLGDGKDIITERELSEPYLIRQDSFD